LTTRYRRTTVVDRTVPMRMTVDAKLVCESSAGVVGLDGLVVLETKSAGRPTPADRWLWAAGHRPVSISKYCVGLAALDPGLPANRWTRTLARVR
ncbi:MAG TPA: VTC domain-containing protein, partial [Actinotalea sp.]|nr:VTC domain-containing protein [Actinotalea sp.]